MTAARPRPMHRAGDLLTVRDDCLVVGAPGRDCKASRVTWSDWCGWLVETDLPGVPALDEFDLSPRLPPPTPIDLSPVALIGCCGQKLGRPAPARELYQSPLFKKSVAWAEARGLRWFVLSARHGLVAPDQVVEPYDVSMASLTREKREGLGWTVSAQVAGLGFRAAPVTVLAGELYAELVRRHFTGPIAEPLKGMGIGERLAFLTPAAAPKPARADTPTLF